MLFSGRYEEADQSFRQSLEAYRRLNNRRQIVDLLKIGTVAYYRGDYGGAFGWYQVPAEQEVAKAADQPWHASALDLTRVNQATLFQRLGRYRAALDLYQKVGSRPEALPVTEKVQLLSNLAVLNPASRRPLQGARIPGRRKGRCGCRGKACTATRGWVPS